MNWAQRLKRVFNIDVNNIDVNTCIHCGGAARIVAAVETPTAIRKILVHFENTARWSKRTTGPHRAHRPLRPRDTPPAAQPTAKPQPDPMRLRSRRLALGPLSGIGEKWPWTARLRGPAMPKSHSQTTDPRPKPALARPPPTRRTV